MTIETRKPALNEGTQYEVIIYPSDEVVQADSSRKHIFSAKTGDKERYIIVDEHWAHQDEQGRITHISISSASITFFAIEELRSAEENAKSSLVKMLNEVGVKLT